MSKDSLKLLTSKTVFLNADKNTFFMDTKDKSYTITTSLDVRLQKTLVSSMNRLKTLNRGKPQRIAIVAMDPATGSLVGMAGFDLSDSQTNPCMASNYPAASIFKLITASAAIDSLGYTAQTPMYFNGNKYTLYKRQLSEIKNKYTTKISLARAFAESINPVFGKLGKNYLGRKRLDQYAQAFGFNQTPDSELEFKSGSFSVTGSEYHLAELGCGFNRETMISPVFGAMLVTTILNSGTSLVPHIVNQVKTQNGQIVYKRKKETYKTAITPKTADTMIQLMRTTVSKGTAKKSFRGFSRDRILSKLIIGGKTGSLYNRERTVKYDWFIGFGKQKTGGKALAVAIVVGHKKYIGTRASTYAKLILKTYFKETPKTIAQLQ
ncbi:MAG: PbpA [Desulfobacteraceae bacterium]|nr:PbpA [Desulfobacteraceae bacterium]